MADNSSKGGNKKRATSLLIILLLALFCAGSFYIYMNTMKVIEENENNLYGETPMPDVKSAEEAKELETTGEEFISMGKATSLAMQTALLAEISGRFPVATPSNLIPPVVSTVTDTGGQSVAVEVEQPIVIEPDPPQVTVLAVMISGKDKIAMIDVLGEDSGLVVKQGSKFSGGDARITKIDEKGVTFTWMKKSYTVAM